MQNIPSEYTRDLLLEIVDAAGFQKDYDVVTLPMDFLTGEVLGYAFLNFKTHEEAAVFKDHFHDFMGWQVPCDKACETSWSDTLQGYNAFVERYRNSPVMHESVDDKFKPALYRDGTRVPFPEPTKLLAESKSNSDHTEKQRSQTWGQFVRWNDETCHVPESSLLSSSEDPSHLRVHKKAERSVKRIKSKLAELGHNPNI